MADTRNPNGPYGGPILPSGSTRNFTIMGQCGIPASATAVAFNFTVTGPVAAGHLTIWPAGGAFPPVSTLNYIPGDTLANGAIVPLGAGGAISVQPFATTHVIIDVNGYFTDVEELAGLNTALGEFALANASALATGNTAIGHGALKYHFSGDANTAVGAAAALGVPFQGGGGSTGEFNVAVGTNALQGVVSGSNNVAVGSGALPFVTTGTYNVGIGDFTGNQLTTGSRNIYIDNPGFSQDEANTIRIGRSNIHTRTFIAGIVTATGVASQVIINSDGQLGIASSSRRVKDDIQDMGTSSGSVLKLRPVSFRYKPEQHDGASLLQYGLIAEEVAAVYPELVVYDTTGEPVSVRYHVLPTMLLNELQRQQRQLEAHQHELDELRAQVRRLVSGRATIQE